MKAIHLTAYGNPAQNLKMVEVSEPNAPSASEALVRMEIKVIEIARSRALIVGDFENDLILVIGLFD